MSRYHGPQAKGAARKTRETKRAEAEQRNAHTHWDRRRGSYWMAFTDGCAIGYDPAGVEHAHSQSADHAPGEKHVPFMRTPARDFDPYDLDGAA